MRKQKGTCSYEEAKKKGPGEEDHKLSTHTSLSSDPLAEAAEISWDGRRAIVSRRAVVKPMSSTTRCLEFKPYQVTVSVLELLLAQFYYL